MLRYHMQGGRPSPCMW